MRRAGARNGRLFVSYDAAGGRAVFSGARSTGSADAGPRGRCKPDLGGTMILKTTTRGSNALASATVRPAKVHESGLEVVAACNVCGSDRILKVDPEFNFCRCDSCGYVFDSPRPSVAAVARFYSQAGKYDSWLLQERARDLLWKRRLRKLLPHRAPGSLLDIGAGIGQFLHHAQPLFAQMTGTEI